MIKLDYIGEEERGNMEKGDSVTHECFLIAANSYTHSKISYTLRNST